MKTIKMKCVRLLAILICFVMLLVFVPQAILAEAGELLNGGEELPEYAFTEDGEEETPAYVVGEGDDRPAGDETVASKLAADPLFAAKDSAVLKYVDEKAFASGKHVKRLADEEALDTYVFLNKDNTKSVYYMFENVKYVDGDGIIREKDNTLVKTERGFSVKDNEYALNIPADPKDGIDFNYDGYPLVITPKNGAENVRGVEYGGSVVYKDYFGEGVSLKYTPVLSGVKEDIVLDSFVDRTYSFELYTGGLYVIEFDGLYYLSTDNEIAASEKATLTLGEIIVYDAIGRPSEGKMTVEALEEGELYIITVSADPAFLADEETVYPVTIDPTVTISDNNSEGSIEDTILFSGKPAKNYANYLYLTAGYTDDTYKIGRVAFRLPGLYNSSAYTSVSANNISSVKFYCRDSSGHATRYVNLYRITSSWTEAAATWNNLSSSYSTATNWGANMPMSAWTEFDITTLVKGWKNGTYTASYGFMLVNTDESTQANKKAPFSSEYTSNTSYRPYVEMTYSIDTSNVISLNYSQRNVNENQITTLTATTNPSGLTVSWSSSNTSVAGVTPSGVISGSHAGVATITASCVYNGVPCSADCIVYVTVPDGIYDITNRNSNLYLTNTHSVSTGTVNVYQTAAYSSSNQNVHEWIRQLWRVHYISDGKYSIRPMNMLERVLDVTSGNVDTWKSSSTVNDSNLPPCGKWTIEYVANNGTYVFKNNGDSSKTMQIQNASTSSNASVIVGSYSASNNCRWHMERYYNPPTGMYLYDTASNSVVADTYAGTIAPVQYVAPEETRTPLVPVQYSTDISQTFTNTSNNTSKATVNASAAVTGVAPTDSPVTITFRKNSSKYISYQLTVTQIPNGTYFLKNKASERYADIEDGNMSAGTQIHQWEFWGGNTQRWIFTHLGNGYYSIKSANSSTAYYMGVEGDGTATDTSVVLRTGTLTNGMKWRIDKTSSGAYKITPKTGEANNRVLAVGFYVLPVNGTHIKQRDYVQDDNYKDEWLFRKINTQLETPLIPQQTSSWCWAASAQMLARTITPSDANNGNSGVILSEQREAVYYVFGDSSATPSTYNWNADPQSLNSTGGLYIHVGMAAAHLVGEAGGSATFSAYATPYSEEALIEFLSDGYPIARLYGWVTFDLTPPVTFDNLKNILLNLNPNDSGHVTVIKGVQWSDSQQCFVFTVFDPWNGGSVIQMTFNELCSTLENTSGNRYKATLWFPSVVHKTDYSSKTFLEEIVGFDYNS